MLSTKLSVHSIGNWFNPLRKTFDKHVLQCLKRDGWNISPEQRTFQYLANKTGQDYLIVFHPKIGIVGSTTITDWAEVSIEYRRKVIVFTECELPAHLIAGALERGVRVLYFLEVSNVTAILGLKEEASVQGDSSEPATLCSSETESPQFIEACEALALSIERREAATARHLVNNILLAAADTDVLPFKIAEGLFRIGLLDEAKLLLAIGSDTVKSSPERSILTAQIETERQDWSKALALWDKLIAEFPDRGWGFVGKGECLRKQGQLLEADKHFSESVERLPEDRGLLWHWAFICHHTRQWETASQRWLKFRESWPDDVAGYSGGMRAARELGQLHEMEQIYELGRERFEGDLPFAIEAAHLAGRQQLWEVAVMRWQVLAQNHPADTGVIEGLGEARMRQAFHVADIAASDGEGISRLGMAPARNTEIESQTKAQGKSDFSPSDLLAGFESLGRDCEFGLLQRRFNLEPLGLLRWGSTSVEKLSCAFRERFARIGSEGTLELSAVHGEYYLVDKIYGISMHTFIKVSEQIEDKLIPKLSARLKFLANKLLEDISAQEKILVFKDHQGEACDVDELVAFHDAVCTVGKCNLLVANRRQYGTAASTVEPIRAGLFVANLSRFGSDKPGWDIPVDEWLHSIQVVHSLVNERLVPS